VLGFNIVRVAGFENSSPSTVALLVGCSAVYILFLLEQRCDEMISTYFWSVG